MVSSEKTPHNIGLALSGGGYRAAAYHLGTMRKLNELGLLAKVDVISSVSGGSIVGADYLLQLEEKNDYKTFENNHIQKLKQSVIGGVLSSGTFIAIALGLLFWIVCIVYLQFSSYYWLGVPVLIVGIVFFIFYQFKLLPISRIVERIYNRIFFKSKILSDLPAKPIAAINSTNLETSRQFTFSKNRMGDPSYEYPENAYDTNFKPIKFNPDNFPVARAVMASSSVPFAFTPVEIAPEYYKNSDDVKKIKPLLVDGGVFDNQGVHKLTHKKSGYECKIVIVSDAGNKLPFEYSHGNLVTLLIRVCDLFMNRIKKFEMTDNIYYNVVLHKKELAYISLGWNLEDCISGFVTNLKNGLVLPEVVAAHKISQNLIDSSDWEQIQRHMEAQTKYNDILKMTDDEKRIARSVSTNLTALTDEQINALIKHAETMTELQVRLYCPTVLKIV